MGLAVEFNSELEKQASQCICSVYTYLEDYLDAALEIPTTDPRGQDVKYSSWLNKTYGNRRLLDPTQTAAFLPGSAPHTEVIEAAKLFLQTTPTKPAV